MHYVLIKQTFRKVRMIDRLNRYPTKLQSGSKRSSKPAWYSKFDCMVGILATSRCGLLHCVQAFFKLRCQQLRPRLLKQLHYNWKTALYSDTGLNQHQKSPSHVKCYLDWKEFLSRRSNKTTVIDLLTDEHARQIGLQEKREYVRLNPSV
jgi:hypothetical protein